MQRRQFIMLGLATGAAFATGLSVYATISPSADSAQSQAALVLDALLPALLLGALSSDATVQQQQIQQTRDAVLEFLPFLPKRTQAELQQLFGLLCHGVTRLALTGHLLALPDLSIDMRLQLLERWRTSYLQLLQQAFHGLRALLLAAFYGQPEQWPALNYQALEFRPYA